MIATIQIIKKRPFSAVPDDILTNKALSVEARLALAYLIGRPENWVIYVWQVQQAVGLSEARWARVRKELVAAGYFSQKRLQNENGRWVWQNTITDTSTIPSKSMDGETIPLKPMDGSPMDGSPMDGKQGDITEENLATEFNNLNKNKVDKEREHDGAAHHHDRSASRTHSLSLSQSSSKFYIDSKTKICLQTGNELDVSALKDISKFDLVKIENAVKKAKSEEKAGRAFPSAVLAILLNKHVFAQPKLNSRQIVPPMKNSTPSMRAEMQADIDKYKPAHLRKKS